MLFRSPELRPEGAELVQLLRIAFRKDRHSAPETGASTDNPSDGPGEGTPS